MSMGALQMASLRDPNRRFASPLSRALARREGLDMTGLPGSGPGGRIVQADVMAALAGGAPCARHNEASDGPAFDAIPNPISRKLIARRLTESKQQAPHFYVRADCNVDAVLQHREAQRKTGGAKYSINDYVIWAAALALRAVPGVNASYTDAAIRRYRQVNIAVAVALDDGLLTPVVEDADLKSLADISAAVTDLSTRARAGKLPPGASRKGTFSISNLGAYGVQEFTAVINPPQGAILAVGAAQPRAVVKDGHLAIATMMTVTLSVDHRVIDGAVAAQWLHAFTEQLESPLSLDGQKAALHNPSVLPR
jgi:pyruvate dehydrogenase E2 component (dihydrolipoamide acetyltransferase)